MPSSTAVYAARKAQGRCVLHGGDRPSRPGKVLCQTCADTQRTYRARQRTLPEQQALLRRQRRRAQGLQLVPFPTPSAAPSGPNLLLCCGQWWTITHIPLLVPCCDRLWFQPREDTP